MKNKKAVKEETFFAKERRLKARKTNLKYTYKKGVYYMANQRLCEYIMQPDVIIRINATGKMEDGTAMLSITLEGFKPSEHGI